MAIKVTQSNHMINPHFCAQDSIDELCKRIQERERKERKRCEFSVHSITNAYESGTTLTETDSIWNEFWEN